MEMVRHVIWCRCLYSFEIVCDRGCNFSQVGKVSVVGMVVWNLSLMLRSRARNFLTVKLTSSVILRSSLTSRVHLSPNHLNISMSCTVRAGDLQDSDTLIRHYSMLLPGRHCWATHALA